MAETLPVQNTPLTPSEAASALASAYLRVTGRAVSAPVLRLLLAQTALETGNWTRQINNFNFGNVKASGTYAGPYVQMYAEGSGPLERFRAYKSAADGAADYIEALQFRTNWWTGLHTGTVDGFVAGLTMQPGAYFTANADRYKSTLAALVTKYGPLADAYAAEHAAAGPGVGAGGLVLMAATIGAWFLSRGRRGRQ